MHPDLVDTFSCNTHKNHFHENCLKKWLFENKDFKCPLCRKKLNLDNNTNKMIKRFKEINDYNFNKIITDLVIEINKIFPHLEFDLESITKEIDFFEDYHNNPNKIVELLNENTYYEIEKEFIEPRLNKITSFIKELIDVNKRNINDQ